MKRNKENQYITRQGTVERAAPRQGVNLEKLFFNNLRHGSQNNLPAASPEPLPTRPVHARQTKTGQEIPTLQSMIATNQEAHKNTSTLPLVTSEPAEVFQSPSMDSLSSVRHVEEYAEPIESARVRRDSDPTQPDWYQPSSSQWQLPAVRPLEATHPLRGKRQFKTVLGKEIDALPVVVGTVHPHYVPSQSGPFPRQPTRTFERTLRRKRSNEATLTEADFLGESTPLTYTFLDTKK